MKLVNIKIVSLLGISYSIALIAMTPLSWLMPYIEPKLSAFGVRLAEPQGSVWGGQVELLEKNVGRVSLKWDIELASLVLLKLPIKMQLSNPYLSLSGLTTLRLTGPSLEKWSGYVDDKALEAVYRRYRADLTGRLQLDEVSGAISWGRQLKDASGNLSWSGGAVTLPVGRSLQNYDVPMMLGNIASDEDAWRFTAKSPEGQQFIEAELSRQGEGVLAVRSAMAKAMEIPIPNMGENIFKVSQQVFDGN